MVTDSPGVPPSATAHELFRGFSYVAPIFIEDNSIPKQRTDNITLSRVSGLAVILLHTPLSGDHHG